MGLEAAGKIRRRNSASGPRVRVTTLGPKRVPFVTKSESQDVYRQWPVVATQYAAKRRPSSAVMHDSCKDSKMTMDSEYRKKFRKHKFKAAAECPCIAQKLPRDCRPGRQHRYFVYRNENEVDLADPEYIRASTAMGQGQIYGATLNAQSANAQQFYGLNQGPRILYIDDEQRKDEAEQ